ncbi:MAG: hypothetical protein AAGD06_25225 [Acidobacteriota bacterium]
MPFEEEAAEFFRTRKIVRVVGEGHELSIFSRLPIAKTKKLALKKAFREKHGARFKLTISETKPFKVDQKVQRYGKFEPIRLHRGAICCGSSVGLGNQRNAGTLTALAKNREGRLFGLSCNHVVGGCSIAQPGIPVVCPGIQDVSVEHDTIRVIGFHEKPAQMAQGLPSVIDIGKNKDLSCFEIHPEVQLTSQQGTGDKAYDTPSTFAEIELGLPVKKWGRSTGFTEGQITYISKGKRPEAIEYNVTSFYGPMNSQTFKGTVYYDLVYEVSPSGKPFSLGGDSGALVVTDRGEGDEQIVGIVIAGETSKSVLLPLQPALDELGLTLISAYNV